MQGWSLELSINSVGMIPGVLYKGLKTIQALSMKHCDIKGRDAYPLVSILASIKIGEWIVSCPPILFALLECDSMGTTHSSVLRTPWRRPEMRCYWTSQSGWSGAQLFSSAMLRGGAEIIWSHVRVSNTSPFHREGNWVLVGE